MIAVPKPHPELIQHCIRYLQTEYVYVCGHQHTNYTELIDSIATRVLGKIAHCDSPYHNLEHTVQVVLVGQEILHGKHLCGEPVSPQEWLHFMVSLLCHDIGYLKGVCSHDRLDQMSFVTGVEDQQVTLSPTATGASLTPYHVDRSKLFVAENFSDLPMINVEIVQRYIELTRFPVPKDSLHKDTIDFPGLARAADLIGQLADPAYLAKLPCLFREFEETGGNQALGYKSPKDLRAGYPKFYWHCVSLYLKHGIRYLEMTKTGRAILVNLHGNRSVVEKELDRFYYGNRNLFQQFIGWFRPTIVHEPDGNQG